MLEFGIMRNCIKILLKGSAVLKLELYMNKTKFENVRLGREKRK